MLNKQMSFYKLLGCGKNGTFDKTPDLRQYGILAVYPSLPIEASASITSQQKLNNYHQNLYGPIIQNWWQRFKCETWTLLLEPTESHGLWDGKQVFGNLPKNSGYEGVTAVLTRATINLNKLSSFWNNVEGAAQGMSSAPGFITSLGVGEVPWVKQATFSVWQSKALMKEFAYKMKSHAEVIKKTRQEKWYKEEMFTRFKVIGSVGTLNGKNPLQDFL